MKSENAKIEDSCESISTIIQQIAYVLNLRKLTFQHLVKLLEPRVSFKLALASLSQPCLLKTTKNLRLREHVGIVGQLTSPKDAKGHYWWFHQRMPGENKER